MYVLYFILLLTDRTATQYDWRRPSVCLSVCLFLTLYIMPIMVGVQGQKLYQRVPRGHVPICPFRHLLYRMYRSDTKRTTNKKAELSQRRPRDAPNIWVPRKISRVLTSQRLLFP